MKKKNFFFVTLKSIISLGLFPLSCLDLCSLNLRQWLCSIYNFFCNELVNLEFHIFILILATFFFTIDITELSTVHSWLLLTEFTSYVTGFSLVILCDRLVQLERSLFLVISLSTICLFTILYSDVQFPVTSTWNVRRYENRSKICYFVCLLVC